MIEYRVSPPISSEALNTLMATTWIDHQARDFAPILARSLLYVCAYEGETLVGYVNVAWDGGVHAFLLDTTVHAHYQRRGIGVGLVRAVVEAARQRDVEWLHVDYEPHLHEFYTRCGFQPTLAGLIPLSAP